MSKKSVERRNKFEQREIYAKCGFFNILRHSEFDNVRHSLLVEKLLKLGQNTDVNGEMPINVGGSVKMFEARTYANWIRNKGWTAFKIEDGCRLFNRKPYQIMEWVSLIEQEYQSVGYSLRYAHNAVPVNVSAIHESVRFNDEAPINLINRKIRPPYDNLFLDFSHDDMVVLQDRAGGVFMDNVGVNLITMPQDDGFIIFATLIFQSYSDNTYGVQFVSISQIDNQLTVDTGTYSGYQLDYVNHCIHTAFFALELMNCKNIVLTSEPEDKRISQMYERQFGIPMTQYKTLTVKPLGASQKNTSEPKDYQGLMPLHLRRGNFAHYTDDKPLFGKYTGMFWRPATAVGERKNGVIIKDYEAHP